MIIPLGVLVAVRRVIALFGHVNMVVVSSIKYWRSI
jgi:hypothetical protein